MKPETFTSIFTSLRQRLQASARSLLGNSDDADDALQDAFYRLWQRRDDLSSEAEATGLSITTVRNICIDRLRRQQAHPTDNIIDDLPLSDDAPPNDDLIDDVTKIIDRALTEQQRRILYMRDYSGYDFDEIAQELDISEANVRVILSRARRTVRECYKKQNNRN